MTFFSIRHIKTKPNFYRIIFFLLILLYASLPTSAQEGYEVKKIRFDGNQTFKKDELLSNMAMYEISFIQRILRRKEPYFYSSEFADNDLECLIRFYQSEGFIYIQANVDTINTDREKRTVDVLFNIREGDPILVDSIAFEFQNAVPS